MAAIAIADPRAKHVEFWERFCSLAGAQVRECNLLAGEQLWSLTSANEPARRFTVASREVPGDRVVCSFDPDRGILTCKPGPATRHGKRRFFVTAGRTCRENGASLTLEEALCQILDSLVMAEA